MGSRFQCDGGPNSSALGLVGLPESRTEPGSATESVERRLYRKAPLFDRFVKFTVQVEGPDIRH
jgi:hypothetical protein